MKESLLVLLMFIFLFSGVSATISNVRTEPLYPNLSSNLIKVYADVSDISKATLYYKINEDIYSSPFSISKGVASFVYEDVLDNVNIVYWIETTNSSGEKESTGEYNLTYDGSAPVTTDDAPASINHDIIITLTCTDTISGCSQTYYSVNDSDFILYTTSFTLTEIGTYQLKYYSIDNAGNNESVKTKLIQINTASVQQTFQAPSGSSNPVIIINNTTNASSVEIISNKTSEKNKETKGKITGGVIYFLGQNKGISIFLGILIVIIAAGFVYLKFRIKRKLYGK